MTSLQDFSEQLAALVEQQARHVVRIRSGRQHGSGVVWSDDGLIVTSDHVIGHRDRISVELPDGTTHKAEFVGRDAATALALIRVDAQGLTPPQWSDGDELRVGQLVVTLGRDQQGPRATLGMVSALGGSWRTYMGGDVNRWIEVDGTLPFVSGGGPLLNLNGQLLGINTHALVRGGTTLPSQTVQRVAAHLQQHGSTQPGYLGVSIQSVELPKAQADRAGQQAGLLVKDIVANSPAEQAGLLLGDILLKLGSQSLHDFSDLLAALATTGNSEQTISVLRGGNTQDITVAIGTRTQQRRQCG